MVMIDRRGRDREANGNDALLGEADDMDKTGTNKTHSDNGNEVVAEGHKKDTVIKEI